MGDAMVRGERTRQHLHGGEANVRTHGAQRSAPRELGDIRLGQIRVGARGAGLRAGQTGVDRCGHRVTIEVSLNRGRLEHVARERHDSDLNPLIGQPVDHGVRRITLVFRPRCHAKDLLGIVVKLVSPVSAR